MRSLFAPTGEIRGGGESQRRKRHPESSEPTAGVDSNVNAPVTISSTSLYPPHENDRRNICISATDAFLAGPLVFKYDVFGFVLVTTDMCGDPIYVPTTGRALLEGQHVLWTVDSGLFLCSLISLGEEPEILRNHPADCAIGLHDSNMSSAPSPQSVDRWED